MTEGLKRPSWWVGDFYTTGATQRGWARAGAAAYRAAHPERYGVTPSVTKSVTVGVTALKSVTPSVTSKKEKTATRVRRWREKQRGAQE